MIKHAKNVIYRLAPAITSFLALILTIHVNSSSGCFILYQPKASVDLDEFKKIK